MFRREGGVLRGCADQNAYRRLSTIDLAFLQCLGDGFCRICAGQVAFRKGDTSQQPIPLRCYANQILPWGVWGIPSDEIFVQSAGVIIRQGPPWTLILCAHVCIARVEKGKVWAVKTRGFVAWFGRMDVFETHAIDLLRVKVGAYVHTCMRVYVHSLFSKLKTKATVELGRKDVNLDCFPPKYIFPWFVADWKTGGKF